MVFQNVGGQQIINVIKFGAVPHGVWPNDRMRTGGVNMNVGTLAGGFAGDCYLPGQIPVACPGNTDTYQGVPAGGLVLWVRTFNLNTQRVDVWDFVWEDAFVCGSSANFPVGTWDTDEADHAQRRTAMSGNGSCAGGNHGFRLVLTVTE
jgi:hypothetical protein